MNLWDIGHKCSVFTLPPSSRVRNTEKRPVYTTCFVLFLWNVVEERGPREPRGLNTKSEGLLVSTANTCRAIIKHTAPEPISPSFLIIPLSSKPAEKVLQLVDILYQYWVRHFEFQNVDLPGGTLPAFC